MSWLDVALLCGIETDSNHKKEELKTMADFKRKFRAYQIAESIRAKAPPADEYGFDG